jgi:alpha-beta hydrolase superfamily lysophospholipase
MKLKLYQRIAIKLYKTKFVALSLLSKKKAAQSALQLFLTPYSGKPKLKIPLFFKKAKPLSFVYQNHSINGWHFTPKTSNHKKILVAHGFDSYTYKYQTFIAKLLQHNYEVIAFDALAHGTSDGKTANALQYAQCMLQIETSFGKLHGIIAHSFGGLALSLAGEMGLHNVKMVLIAPATETTSAIKNFFSFLKIPKNLYPNFCDLILEKSGKDVQYFSAARAVENTQNKILWVHDTNDIICAFADVATIKNKQLPHIEFYITTGLGHNAIYRAEKVQLKVIEFLG